MQSTDFLLPKSVSVSQIQIHFHQIYAEVFLGAPLLIFHRDKIHKSWRRANTPPYAYIDKRKLTYAGLFTGDIPQDKFRRIIWMYRLLSQLSSDIHVRNKNG